MINKLNDVTKTIKFMVGNFSVTIESYYFFDEYSSKDQVAYLITEHNIVNGETKQLSIVDWDFKPLETNTKFLDKEVTK